VLLRIPAATVRDTHPKDHCPASEVSQEHPKDLPFLEDGVSCQVNKFLKESLQTEVYVELSTLELAGK
jgi:hypothetical protein